MKRQGKLMKTWGCREGMLEFSFPKVLQQYKRWLYTWTSLDGQIQIAYILCSRRWRNSIESAKTRLGVDCGSGHELLIAKFRLKMKKVGKTNKPILSVSEKFLSRVQFFANSWTVVRIIEEWVALPFFRGSSQPRYRTQVSCISSGFFTSWVTREAHGMT